MNKMILVAYNEAIEDEMMEALTACNLQNYTKIPGTFGRGQSSGTHLGDEVWPGMNNLLLVAAAEPEIKKFVSSVREMRKRLGSEGLKAFTWNLEEIT